MKCQRIGERSRSDARGGMHDHASWFVDDNKIVVFVKNATPPAEESGENLWDKFLSK